MASIEVGPQTLHFEDTGGSGPAGVFFPRIGHDSAEFSPQRPASARRAASSSLRQPRPWLKQLRCLPRDGAKYTCRALVDRDEVVPRLKRITAPTLVLHGSADLYYTPAQGEEIAKGFAACRGFVLVEGGAHFLSLTDPEPVNTALQELFEALA